MKTDNKEMPFVFYPSFRSQLKAIKNKDIRAIICEALIDYGVCGTEPDFSEVDPLGTIDALFVPMRQEIDKAKARYLACVENGKKGGAPKGNKNNRYCKNNQSTTENNQSTTENNQSTTENNLNKDIDKDIDINGIKDTLSNNSNQRLERKNSTSVLPVLAQKDYVFVMDLWNGVCTNLRSIAKLTSKNSGGKRSDRKGAIRYCLNFLAQNFTENKTLDEANGVLRTAFKKANASHFLCGGGERGWKADFDWVMRDDHLTKILEGSYDNTDRPAPTKNSNTRNCNDEWS